MAEMEDFDLLLDEITSSANQQGIPAGVAIAEYGPGQYEITLSHVASALRAADDAVLFKRAVQGIARRHGMEATFMAKPYANQASSGMHVHMSMQDTQGRNVFADPAPEGSPALRHVIGGLMQVMPACAALAAPGANSWRRLRPGGYAPTSIAWGVNNRTVPLRIPSGSPESRRVEYRIAGADANPYLTVASLLAGALHGLEGRLDPGPPLQGSAYERSDLPQLPRSWEEALDAFHRSALVRRWLGDRFVDVYATTKRAEMDKFAAQVTPLEWEWYLRG
jgi:glutamine synthetase